MKQQSVKLRHDRGYLEQLTDLFIRPPKQIYELKSLGPTTFFYQKLMICRDDFVVQSRRNLKLQCSLYSAVRYKETDRPCVIYLHGNSSSRLDGSPLAGMICNEGMSFLTFDFSGCGLSEGEFISLGWFEKDELMDVLEYLKQAYPKLSRFGLWGRSMGATTALMAAAENTELTKVIVADSPFQSLKQLCLDIGDRQFCLPRILVRFAFYVVRKRVLQSARYDPKHLNIVTHMRKMKASVMFLHASDDRMVSQNQVTTLFQVCNSEKYIMMFAGDHNSLRPVEVYQNVVKFFVNRLNPNKEAPVIITNRITAPKITPKKQDSEHTKEKLNDSHRFEGVPEFDFNEKINVTHLKPKDESESENQRQFEENRQANQPHQAEYIVRKWELSGSDSERCIPIEQESQGDGEISKYQLNMQSPNSKQF